MITYLSLKKGAINFSFICESKIDGSFSKYIHYSVEQQWQNLNFIFIVVMLTWLTWL